MLTTYGKAINRILNGLDFHVTRRSTLDSLISNANLRQNEIAHNFRLIPREGEPTELVPTAYLKMLQLESLALRDRSTELASLRRQIAADGPSTTPSTSAEAAKPKINSATYDYCGLRSEHNHDFLREPRFVAAYQRGAVAEGYDPKYYWRAHVALWCASVALALGGDFVECGVCRGMLSSSIMKYLDWNNTGRRFFLFDTFTGLDETQLTDEEAGTGNLAQFREMYKEDLYDNAARNFSEFTNVKITQGSVPSTLSTVDIADVAYLSIDMNNTTPEIAALNHFWDKLQPGAPILLDDYGIASYEVQKRAFDAWAIERQVSILVLPTGQALMIKPPS
jgi:hypothetical protein